MVKTFARILTALGIAGGFIYGVLDGVWSVGILFALVGIFYEASVLRDMLEEKFSYGKQSIAHLDIFKQDSEKH